MTIMVVTTRAVTTKEIMIIIKVAKALKIIMVRKLVSIRKVEKVMEIIRRNHTLIQKNLQTSLMKSA